MAHLSFTLGDTNLVHDLILLLSAENDHFTHLMF